MITALLTATILAIGFSSWYFHKASGYLELREPYSALFYEQAERLMARKPPEVVENILLSLGAAIVMPDSAKRISVMLDDDAPLSAEGEAKRAEVESFVLRDDDTRRIFYEAVHSGLLAVSYASVFYGPAIRRHVEVSQPIERREQIALTIEERTPMPDIRSANLLAA